MVPAARTWRRTAVAAVLALSTVVGGCAPEPGAAAVAPAPVRSAPPAAEPGHQATPGWDELLGRDRRPSPRPSTPEQLDRRRALIERRRVERRAAATSGRTLQRSRPARPAPASSSGGPHGRVRCATHQVACDQVRAATAVLPDGWQHLGWDVVAAGPHAWAGGMADATQRTLTVHVRDFYTDAQVASIVAHEFGHVWWHARLDEGQRRRWRHVRGLGDAPTYATGPHDNTAVIEDHAETVRLHLVGGFDGRDRPDAEQLAGWQHEGLLPGRPG